MSTTALLKQRRPDRIDHSRRFYKNVVENRLLRGVRGYTYAKCGRRAEARAELNRLLGRARAGEYVSHYALAIIQAGLGDDDQAIAELEKAYIERAPGIFVMKLEPAFARLHSDPRFVAVARKIGLTI
ncbi:MAG: TPR end-of-group domain-containing protein [Burkholderiales bacterium]